MNGALSAVDTFIVASYLAAIVAMSWAFARRQRTGDDYFLAGRAMGGAALGASVLANQASAISLVGAPAFVALRAGNLYGGDNQYGRTQKFVPRAGADPKLLIKAPWKAK